MTTLVSPWKGLLPGSHQPGKTRGRGRGEPGMTLPQFLPRRTCVGDGPPVDVTAWRLCRLLEAGFAEDLATRLARDPRVDVHGLLGLVDQGCPPQLAARILAPLPEPWGTA